ncbi:MULTISPECIES: B12-binding domain-containing protein [Sporomusa]|jgi:corrinoid protein of di/trimethylamine methyltransferase|uniref:glycine betaine-specific corrinoid protein MtgC n=1 Tax=Sporomusa TaxID=2375 RepID=UPI00202E4E81|nr:corrinoid protein [Sporomusa sphaeroides]MCM0759752.1 corrinoid protein [Sporomusa sphaeroides DSM 2875]HML33692.1 corrinoid protein [Sporomusa sphaeroides]
MSEIFENLRQAILDGDEELVAENVQKVIDDKLDPVAAIQNGLIKGIEELGIRWKAGEAFLPDVMMGADALKAGLDMLEPVVAESGATGGEAKGKIVLGQVAGDIHDIGKNIVGAMMTAAGYKVYDIGIDQPAESFLAKAEEVGADMIAAGALLTTTMAAQKAIVDYLRSQNVREKYTVMIGGGPTSQAFADEIGADAWAETADEAVTLCDKLIAG